MRMFEDVVPKAIAKETKQRREEFASTPYQREDTVERFDEFLAQCWRAYCESDSECVWPVAAVVQGEGFGKSRLLFEQAKRTKETQGADARMRVFYTCARDENSQGVPQATSKMIDLFFTGSDRGLVDRLARLFDFAMSRWDTVGGDWIKIMTDGEQGVDVQPSMFDIGTQPRGHGMVCDTHANRRVIVFAIDEAQELLSKKQQWHEKLGPAFNSACRRIRKKYGAYAGVFAVVLATSDPIRQAHMEDTSGRSPNRVLRFPPFVLSHTMNTMANLAVQDALASANTERSFYQRQVLSATIAKDSLISLGRPLWKSCYGRLGFDGVIELAAEKLLCHHSPADLESFNQHTMYGVASMLCRLGIRPLSSSSFSKHAVAQLMATLLHVRMSTDRFVTAYPSEPMLTFGAARVWYAASTADDPFLVLHRHILPQLCGLIQDECVDTGDAGVVKARIVLLLAMDTLSALSTDLNASRNYVGDLYSVWAFVSVLGAGTKDVEDINHGGLITESAANIIALETKWTEWHVGFSHFVQLTEEVDETHLWGMLSRRAAGVRPRNCTGADLIIPASNGTRVSMILVQVVNRPDGDPSYALSAWAATKPNHNFTHSPLCDLAGSDVFRLRLDLGNTHPRPPFYLRDPSHGQQVPAAVTPLMLPVSYVLCMQGLPSAVFLSTEVVAALKTLLEPWWQPRKMIEADLATRPHDFGLNRLVGSGDSMAVGSRWNRATNAPSSVATQAATPDSSTNAVKEESETHKRKPQASDTAQKKSRR